MMIHTSAKKITRLAIGSRIAWPLQNDASRAMSLAFLHERLQRPAPINLNATRTRATGLSHVRSYHRPPRTPTSKGKHADLPIIQWTARRQTNMPLQRKCMKDMYQKLALSQ